MNQRKINSRRSKLGRLARNHCANYKSGGACDLQRCGLCTVEIKTDSIQGISVRILCETFCPQSRL